VLAAIFIIIGIVLMKGRADVARRAIFTSDRDPDDRPDVTG
jgi:hypothetical protein